MSRARSLAAGGAALALAFVMAGCGGDSGLTTEEFRKQADKICADFEDKSNDLFAGISATSSEADLVEAFKKVADLLDEQSDQIGALEAPDSISDDVDAMLDSIRAGADKVREDGLELIKTGENPLEDATKKADDLGLKSCASAN